MFIIDETGLDSLCDLLSVTIEMMDETIDVTLPS
jgi:hypothetical protein